MHDKISWYEEILAQDPASPLFYHLAHLYTQQGQLEKAVPILREGLSRHPAHAQARLLLVQTLMHGQREEEAREALSPLRSMLTSYPRFWELWAALLEEEEQPDMALAVRFIADSLRSGERSWLQVLRAGLSTTREQGGEIPEDASVPVRASFPEESQEEDDFAADAQEPAPEPDQARDDADLVPEEEEEPVSLERCRTLTMADILAGQGDVQAAQEIYAELLDKETDPERRQDIHKRLQKMQEEPDSGGDGRVVSESKEEFKGGGPSKNQDLLRRLDQLASRLEARS